MVSETKCKLFETKLTTGQLICINKMISEKRLVLKKDNIILDFTKGRTVNVKELFVNEATDIIRFLKDFKYGAVYEAAV
ncbi:MAG TPA: hypothetical protein PL009_01430 [Flavipsychrobacter sp.]|nr:hypothetical protein [Flavipsychrobacter sp.]